LAFAFAGVLMATFVLVLFLWVFSVCLHEFAHARVAYAGGDTSVREKGYLSMNPVKYLDPMYSIILPVLFLMLGGLGLPGAAVYIDHSKLRSAHWDSAVSLAGPAANLFLLLVIAILLRFAGLADTEFGPALAFLGLLQASAVVLNLLPLPGSDGFGAIAPYLRPETRQQFEQYGRQAIWVLVLLLIFVPPFARALWGLVYLLAGTFGIPLGLAGRGYDDFRFW
jgi:Zn-dependent protease